jgi:hypothetical protein
MTREMIENFAILGNINDHLKLKYPVSGTKINESFKAFINLSHSEYDYSELKDNEFTVYSITELNSIVKI